MNIPKSLQSDNDIIIPGDVKIEGNLNLQKDNTMYITSGASKS